MTRTRLRCLFDVDGVLADLVGAMCKTPGAHHLTPEDFTVPYFSQSNFPETVKAAIESRMCERGLVRTLQVYPGAISAVVALQEYGHEVVFVTHPYENSPTWAHDRAWWLETHFPGVPVVQTKHKELIHGDALVEDTPANLEKWLLANPGRGRGFLIERPWNRAHRAKHPMIMRVGSALEAVRSYLV